MSKKDWKDLELWEKVARNVLAQCGEKMKEEQLSQLMAELKEIKQAGRLSNESVAEALRNLGERGIQTGINIDHEQVSLMRALRDATNGKSPEMRGAITRRFFGGRGGKEGD